MASTQDNQETLNNNTSIQITESHNLIFKLYAAVLTNPAVQNGVKQITRLSQPLLGKLDNNMVKLTTTVNKLASYQNVQVIGDSTLNFVENRLNFVLRLLGQEQEEQVEDKNLTEKTQRILRKTYLLSTIPLKKVESVFRQIQATKTYATINDYIHLNEKIDKSIFLTLWGYNILKENILEPSVNKIKVIKSKAKNQVTIVMHDLDIQILKKKYSKLYAKYEVLQYCAVTVANDTLKLIFDKQSLAKLGEDGKKELLRFYHEVKTMEAEKIKTIGIEYYSKILKQAQKTYNNAQSDLYKKKEITNQENATVVDAPTEPIAVEQN